MSDNTANTPIDSLEFDQIKTNLKDYLRGQQQFKDYDFEGSSLSIILDILAYNTHYQAYYANMAANESFLDSAVIRQSVVSLAKHLDYVPRSKKAATLVVDVFYENNTESFTDDVIAGRVFLAKNQVFRGVDQNGKAINFVNLQTHQVTREGGVNAARGVVLSQGNLKSISFVANTSETAAPVFTIPDRNVDVDTLSIVVQRSTTVTDGSANLWVRGRDITKLSGDTRVFFVQEGSDGLWQFYFGDGILGRQIQNGNLITANYLVTAGSVGNGIGFNDDIRLAGTVANVISVAVQTEDDGTIIPSFGGEDEESVSSIKFYAPRTYQAQERAVTADDYLAVLGREYSSRADSYFIWGGEENIPPQYGKVFISIRPKQGRRLSFGEKQAIEKSILGERNLVTITPEVVDPDFLYIIPTVTVYYDEAKTLLNSQGVASKVRDFISAYNTEELGGFQKNFRSSNFTSLVDALAPTINSNTLELKLSKALEPALGRSATYTIRFDNALYHPIDGYIPIISSESFLYRDDTSSALVKPNVSAYLEDDGFGNIRIYKIVNNAKITIKSNIGSVDYETGLITLKNFAPVSLAGGRTEIRITVQPRDKDIFSRRNQILEIDTDIAAVTAIPEKTKIYNSSTDSAFPR
jgi:hypothetical protein